MKQIHGIILALVGILAVFCLLFSEKTEKAPSLIPRKVLFGPDQKNGPQISPDGSLVAYLAPQGGVLNIWLHDRKTKTDRVLTRDKNRGIQSFFWVPGGPSILFLQDQGGNENWHLYRSDVTGGGAKDLTPFDGVQVRVLFVDKHFPDQILILMNREDQSRHDVYRLDLNSGAIELVEKNTGQISKWIVDAAMKVRGAVSARADGGHDVLIRQDERSAWKTLFSWDFEDAMTSDVLGFSRTGNELYLIDSRGSNTARLGVMDLVTGTAKTFFSDPQYDVGGVVVDPDDREIEMVSVYRSRNEWIPLHERVRADLAILKTVDAGDLSFGNRSEDKRYWIVGFNNDVSPLKSYIYDQKSKKAEFLFTQRPALAKYKLAPMKSVEISSRDGLKLQSYLTLPDNGSKPFPMVLVVHGGPWMRDGWGFSPVSQWLANRGYASLRVNFRGSTGFGKQFVNAGNKEWGRKMQDDLVDAVAWAVQQKIADPKRLGIIGSSYGGYAALAAAAFTPDVFQCAIDLFGPSDLATLIRSMPPYWSVEKANIMRMVGNPDTETAFMKERSPLYHADRIRIPVLVAQGENDSRTPRTESDRIVQALRIRGIPCEYLFFPDEGHGFVKPENRLKLFQTAEAFLARHLGGRFEK
ncbi:MAG TPA: S9 family peptidase [Candidatus Omnitrophota bacterium]|nr:S9 family peptidase [Candidatus Omnitrophota bacterium]